MIATLQYYLVLLRAKSIFLKVGYIKDMDRCYLLIFHMKDTDELCLRPNQSTEEGETHTCRTLTSLRQAIKDTAKTFFGRKRGAGSPSTAVGNDDLVSAQKERACEVVLPHLILLMACNASAHYKAFR